MAMDDAVFYMLKYIKPEDRRMLMAYDLGFYDGIKAKKRKNVSPSESKDNNYDLKIPLKHMANKFYIDMPIEDMTGDMLRCAVAILRDMLQKETNNERSK